MYEVFVNDRPFCLTAGSPSIGPTEDPSSVMKEAFERLENGSIERFEISGDLENLWYQFTELFKVIEAAGGVTFDPQGRLLVIKRWGKWDLPKGKMEEGESPAESALREVEEECGITNLELVSPLFSTYHTYRMKDKPVLKVTHWFAMKSNGSESLVPQTEEGIEEVVWMERSRWPEILENTYANISRLIQAQT